MIGNAMKFTLKSWGTLLFVCLCLTQGHALAHPMGNFSINHYARFRAETGVLKLRHIVDYAEIPTSERMPQLDSDDNGKVSDSEKSDFPACAKSAPRMLPTCSRHQYTLKYHSPACSKRSACI